MAPDVLVIAYGALMFVVGSCFQKWWDTRDIVGALALFACEGAGVLAFAGLWLLLAHISLTVH